MRTMGFVRTLVLSAAVLASCVDNDVSFFIEHVKAEAKAPECVTDVGGDRASHGSVDLALADEYSAFYYLTNGTMAREEFGALRAETDGIIVEGMEVYVQTPGGTIIGGSENVQSFDFQNYIPPENSDIINAIVIPTSVIDDLRDDTQCRKANSYDKEEVAAGILNETFPPETRDLGIVYSVIRFFGRTQGGSEVVTQDFSFLVNLCCNCSINWRPCELYNGCCAACITAVNYVPPVCQPGIGGGSVWDCRDIGFEHPDSWFTPNGSLYDCARCVNEELIDDCMAI